MIDPQKFKISCSAIGRIMADSKELSKSEKIKRLVSDIDERRTKRDALKDGLKSKETATEKINSLVLELETLGRTPDTINLSETCKTYCKDWVTEQIYGRRKEFTSKQTDKGNKTEFDAVELLENFYGWNFAAKNSNRKSNDFMSGECDIVLSDTIVDIKSSFSCFTFPLFETKIPESDYEWQIQGYMHLWEKQKGMVSYVLMDMPDEMIDRELRWKFKDGYTKEQYEADYAKYIYSNIDVKYRVKSFEFEYDAEKIEAVKSRVELCREYIGTLVSI
jgi:hypothetical protein